MAENNQKSQEPKQKLSRIGKAPIAIPAGVKINIEDGFIKVEGPKGKLSQKLTGGITVSVDGGTAYVACEDGAPKMRAQHGLMRTLLANMVEGVTNGFVKNLEIIGVGYKVAMKGKDLDLSMGFSHPCIFKAPEGIEFAVDGTTKIAVKGIDKQLVGQVAANIRKIRKPEPYKGKGIRYAGEYVAMKAGKSGKK
ncbi:MAG: 50S ribosomal protein L6 [Mucispirillum sp.]|nr:50S ribosomal protein L6 [Mucispirillum sp.]